MVIKLEYQDYDDTKTTINCNSLVSDFLNNVSVVRCNRRYYVYDNDTGVFSEKTVEEIQIMVAKRYETITRKEYHVKYSRQIIELLKIRIEEVECMEPDSDKLCVANCVIDLVTGEIFEHSPLYRFITKTDIEYNPDAKCPLFMKFLNQICLGNINRRKSLEELCGLCLTKNVGYGCAFVIYGHGANGKSIFMNVLCALVGKSSYTSITLKELSSFGSGKIPGKKLVVLSEVNKTSSADLITNEMKQLITGEHMDCNVKFKQNVDMRPYCKVVVLTNHQIGFLTDDSEGSLRRIFICPFEYYVPPSERDYQLEDKLLCELSGILNVAINGLKRLRANGYQYSGKDESDKIVNELLRNENPLRAFVREKITYAQGNFVSYNTIISQYTKWCEKNGVAYELEDIESNTNSSIKAKSYISKRIFKEISNYHYVDRACSNGLRGIKNVKLKSIIK